MHAVRVGVVLMAIALVHLMHVRVMLVIVAFMVVVRHSSTSSADGPGSHPPPRLCNVSLTARVSILRYRSISFPDIVTVGKYFLILGIRTPQL